MSTVLMLTWEYPPLLVGGLARHVHALSRALVEQNRRVIVLTRATNGQASDQVEDGVRVVRVSPYFQEPQDFTLWVNHLNFGLLEAGVRLIRELQGPFLLHAHDWLTAHAAKGLKHLFQVPLVATVHATEHGRNNGIHDLSQQYISDVEWWLTYEAWRVIVCSGAMQQEVTRLFDVPADKIRMIPNGISLTGFRANRRSTDAATCPEGERVIFTIGRLVREKGLSVLIAAMPYLLRRHNVRLLIAGVGPFRTELERQVREMQLTERVQLLGWLSDQDAARHYLTADCTVVPSLYEPFGIVALEAMAAGTPLVASDVGGLSEIVEHGVTGLKAAPGDPEALAAQVDRLLSDHSLAERLAKEALRRVESVYSWAGVARETGALYDAVQTEWAQSSWGSMRG